MAWAPQSITCDAQQAAPRAVAWPPRSSTCDAQRAAPGYGLGWVEPVFRDFFREKWHFFSRSEMRRKWHFFRESEKWRKIVLFAVRNAAKNGPVLGCELGRACFSRNFSAKMALCCWRKMAENGAFQKKFERKKLAKMALLKRRTGFPQGLGTTIKYLRCATSGAAGNGLDTTAKYRRCTTSGAAGDGLGTSVRYLRGAAGNGLGTMTKYLRRNTSGAAGSGLGTKAKYLRRTTSAAAGDAQRAAPRATA
jgi:hypothetical protein